MWSNVETDRIPDELADVLPRELKDGAFKLTSAYLTTYSLDTKQLINVLYSLDALRLIGEGKVHVFYDKCSRAEGQGETQGIPEKYLHAVSQDNRVFHPKVILLRYEKNDDSVWYAVIVTSKNLTDAKLVDAFACAHGKVGAADSENGKAVADFFKDVFDVGKFNGNADILKELKKTLKELKKTEFGQSGDGVAFLRGNEVFQKIKDKKDIIAVSPFLSDGFVKSVKGLKMLVSTKNGFSRLSKPSAPSKTDLPSEKTTGELIEKTSERTRSELCEKTRIFPMDNLHAKIYCWQEDEKAHWIVGSSNATNNGCGINAKSGNTEFNIEFCTEPGEYDKFREMFENRPPAAPQMFGNIAEEFDAAGYLKSFLNSVTVKCEKGEKYKCVFEKAEEIQGYKAKARISGRSEFSPVTAPLEADAPFHSVDIRISSKKDSGRVFCVGIYGEWDTEIRGLLDKRANDAYKGLMKRLVDNILKGKRGASGLSDTDISPTGQGSASRGRVDKSYIFERVMSLSAKYTDDGKFREKLDEIKKYAELCGDKYYDGLVKFIDEIEKHL